MHIFNRAYSVVREFKKTLTRSPLWRSIRKQHLKEFGYCQACGSKSGLQVHHIIPFHMNPSLELLDSNLISLCMSQNECHLKLGHGDSWKSYNPNVFQDAIDYKSANASQRRGIISRAKLNRKKDF